ncbi:unnamed protein product [Closterium sp. NIES-64]|nr:unnamed protein product [Closterium sp. NIES-64]
MTTLPSSRLFPCPLPLVLPSSSLISSMSLWCLSMMIVPMAVRHVAAHLEGELEGQNNDDIEGEIHLYTFRTSSGAFNVLYVLTVKQLPQQSPPTNATITRGRSVALTFPATWRETTGQPGFKQNDADDDDDGDCPDGKCYSYAAVGYWANADKTITDVVNGMIADATAYQGHMTLPSGEDVKGEFELD